MRGVYPIKNCEKLAIVLQMHTNNSESLKLRAEGAKKILDIGKNNGSPVRGCGKILGPREEYTPVKESWDSALGFH